MSGKLPAWALAGRGQWTNVGRARPSFAQEPGPGQESVWDYPRPPALVADPRSLHVELGGVSLARTSQAYRVLETSHPPTFYLPPQDVRLECFTPVGKGSRCEWKGEATYWNVSVGERQISGGAWSYEHPFGEFEAIAGYVSFYPALFACYVGGARVEPQPGGFYGGWITPELVGPFKGGLGSSGW